ncbi:MAG: DUF3373 family protein [Desulfurivibrionaceae bacterium]
MRKRISTLALAGLLAMPAAASAADAAADMQAKIDAMSKQIEQMKAQMTEIKTSQEQKFEDFDAKSEKWDLASRFQWSGDFRSRIDYANADTPAHYEALNVARGVDAFTSVQPYLAGITGAGPFSTTGGLFAGLMTGTGAAGPYPAAAGGFLASPTALQFALTTGAGQPLSSVSVAQATALWSMFTNAEVGAMLGGMPGATPTSAITNQMANAQSLVGLMKGLSPAARSAIFANMGYNPTAAQDYTNDTIWTNRLRLDLRAKATENVEFKGRLAMYKAWGMQNNPTDYSYNNGMGGGPFALSGYMSDFDGATTRNPNDSILRVDRAYVNWNNIADSPVWFSIGRRPTTDGPPANLKLGSDERMATPAAVMDWPFDGLTIGYAYNNLFGIEDAPGRIRFCYGRGFEAGPDSDKNQTLNDVDFAGFSWDVYKKGNRFFYLQSYGAFNVFNVPDNVNFANPLEFAAWERDNTQFNPLDSSKDMLLGRANLGNLYHTSGVYMDKVQNLNYFLTGSWSRTDAQGMDEMGTSLLGEWWDEPEDRNGYHFHVGVRYDMNDLGLKLGAEFNHGSKYWIAMSPGHDDMYVSKLATRGDVYEVYGIYDIPGGEAISKYGKAWMRLGFQHYEYDYTGSGFWLGAPKKIEDLANDPMNAQFYTPIDKMDQVYLTFEASF